MAKALRAETILASSGDTGAVFRSNRADHASRIVGSNPT